MSKRSFKEISIRGIAPQIKCETNEQQSVIINDHFAMLINGGSYIWSLLQEEHIYHIAGNRIIIVLNGEIDTTLDLEEQHWSKGDIILLAPNTIQEVKKRSSDFDMIAINIEDGDVIQENTILHANLQEFEENLQIVNVLWNLANHTPFRLNTVRWFFSAIVNNIYDIVKNNQVILSSHKVTNGELLFNRFKMLVNKYCHIERNIPFYADKLFITPHHLSAVIKKQSGKSVMYWINRATILKAKVMLKSNDLKTNEIAEHLNFSYHSTFTKFFKRETGLSPQEYRDKD